MHFGFLISQAHSHSLRAIGVETGIDLWSLDAVEMCHAAGFLARVFACFDKSVVSLFYILSSQSQHQH
jgi:hypothetical protein